MMSPALTPERLALFARFVSVEDRKDAHQEKYPDWWADKVDLQDPARTPRSPADEEWTQISYDSVAYLDVLQALREVVAESSVSCQVHADCAGNPELAAACARTKASPPSSTLPKEDT